MSREAATDRLDDVEIRVARVDERRAALALMYAHQPASLVGSFVDDLMSAHEAGSLPLDEMLVATRGHTIVGTGLLAFAVGNVALFWPPRTRPDNGSLATRLLEEMLARIDRSAAAFAQCLLAPGHHDAAVMRTCGLTAPIELIMLTVDLAAATVDAVCSPDQVESVETESYEEANDRGRFVRVLGQTYVGSADSPEVTGLQSAEVSLDGHLATGRFRPDLSRLCRVDGRDAGLMLVSEHDEYGTLELVYTGIVPGARGQGLGKRLLQDVLRRARQSNAVSMFLAVDTRNHFAIDIYREFGFVESDRQEVWLYVPQRS